MKLSYYTNTACQDQLCHVIFLSVSMSYKFGIFFYISNKVEKASLLTKKYLLEIAYTGGITNFQSHEKASWN